MKCGYKIIKKKLSSYKNYIYIYNFNMIQGFEYTHFSKFYALKNVIK